MKTVILPVTSLVVASTPLAFLSRLPHVLFWIWIQLLCFDLSNQTLKPEEDEYNKPDRPLPSKRITFQSTLLLRWALVPVCWIISAFYSIQTVYASIALCISTILYNEMGFSNHWLIKNALNVPLYMSCEVGACLIASENRHRLDRICIISLLCSAGVKVTTIYAQDFKDVIGDRLIGRKTLPIAAPTIARPVLMLGILAWTSGLAVLWKLNTTLSLALHALALCVGARYMLYRTIKGDQRSYYLYNVWLSVVHILPAYFRFVAYAQ